MGQSWPLDLARLLVLVMASLTLLGAGGEDSRTEHQVYPAASLETVQHQAPQEQALTQRLQSVTSGYIARQPWQLFRVGEHELLKDVLPGVKFYLVTGRSAHGWPKENLVAVRDTQYYFMPARINRLLRDCGSMVGPEDVEQWARMAALFWCGQNRFRLAHMAGKRFEASERWNLPYYPEVEFQRVDTSVLYSKGLVVVELSAGGTAVELRLSVMLDREPDNTIRVLLLDVWGPTGSDIHFEWGSMEMGPIDMAGSESPSPVCMRPRPIVLA